MLDDIAAAFIVSLLDGNAGGFFVLGGLRIFCGDLGYSVEGITDSEPSLRSNLLLD